ncbi:uncharacterized protein LOC62_01G001015 [Vanrija pseudolonga]|uniref:SAP domain-containing protein n=1 Tax=Vanrija pseudolonga TaxID=143232 RepID=A0AAF0Y0D5_9TREE|nr:hypothetical protein LOC62_01G001015 [Vanrija pseudolonga]
MLRRRLSAGALRARAQAQAQQQQPLLSHAIHTGPKSAPATPQRLTTPTASAAKATISAHPAQQQSASLASAVLLGTQRSWKNETVVTLRAELKRRGLSQQGKKALLITRLESADASAFLPPVPPLSKAAKAAKGQRELSTTPPAQVSATPPAQVSVTPPVQVSATPPAQLSTTPPAAFRGDATSKSDDGTTDTEAVSSTGPAVETSRTEAPLKAHDVTPEVLTTAPGLPIKKRTSGNLLDIKFPTPKPDAERTTPIPLIGSYAGRGSSSSRGGAVPSSSGPRVMTVASASTHIGGGPLHGSGSRVADSYAAEFHDFSHLLSQPIEEVIAHPMISLRKVGVPIPVINLPPPPKGGDKYVASTEPLSSDEKRGALWLVGALGTVFLLTGWARGGREDVFADNDAENATHAGKVAAKADAAAESARASLDKLQIKDAKKEASLKDKDLTAEAKAERKLGRAEAKAAAAHVNAQAEDVKALIEAIKKALDADAKGKGK